MKFQLSAALMGLAATAVSAQYNQTGPFYLQIKGTNAGSSINGFASSCHAGAAIEGLCYGDTTSPNGTYFEYYFNYTGYTDVGGSDVGILVWNLPYTDQDGNPAFESESMGLVYQINSNVAAPLFGLSNLDFSIGFDSENKAFGYDYIEDSTFTPGQEPASNEGKAYYQWAVCWQYFTGYFYQSVAWVQVGNPTNPTCEPIDLIKVPV
ncbi:hypothetical protein F5Y19DRAFT_109017 [Xylariaceae sp. FL1651]|nr:hypothetical protein F5Y19DRAFT_109017 [Xylariaceae sp. FL1651]